MLNIKDKEMVLKTYLKIQKQGGGWGSPLNLPLVDRITFANRKT